MPEPLQAYDATGNPVAGVIKPSYDPSGYPDGSVAQRANNRLSSQGLTPEMVKAGHSVSPPKEPGWGERLLNGFGLPGSWDAAKQFSDHIDKYGEVGFVDQPIDSLIKHPSLESVANVVPGGQALTNIANIPADIASHNYAGAGGRIGQAALTAGLGAKLRAAPEPQSPLMPIYGEPTEVPASGIRSGIGKAVSMIPGKASKVVGSAIAAPTTKKPFMGFMDPTAEAAYGIAGQSPIHPRPNIGIADPNSLLNKVTGGNSTPPQALSGAAETPVPFDPAFAPNPADLDASFGLAQRGKGPSGTTTPPRKTGVVSDSRPVETNTGQPPAVHSTPPSGTPDLNGMQEMLHTSDAKVGKVLKYGPATEEGDTGEPLSFVEAITPDKSAAVVTTKGANGTWTKKTIPIQKFSFEDPPTSPQPKKMVPSAPKAVSPPSTAIPDDIRKLSSDPTGPAILGQIAQSPHAETLWKQVPSGSRIIGHGFEAVVLDNPKTPNEVIRIGRVVSDLNERPKIDGVLQPIAVQKYGNWTVERLPKVQMGASADKIQELRNRLAAQGYELYDAADPKAIKDNVGMLDGRAVVVDGGAVIKSK